MKIPFFPTVDSLISDFSYTVQKLEALADLHATRADGLQASAARQLTKANANTSQAERARAIAHKINSLIS